MYKIEGTIQGVSPLRYNRYLILDRPVQPGGHKQIVNKKKMTHEEQIEDALARSYRDEKKGFYIPAAALRACFIMGGKKVKIGRGGASNLLKAIMIFDEEKYFLGTTKYKIQQDVVRIPPITGARIVQYWVVIEKWKCKFTISILDDVFPEDGLRDSIAAAGLYYGLLDGRPQLGRFELIDFKRKK